MTINKHGLRVYAPRPRRQELPFAFAANEACMRAGRAIYLRQQKERETHGSESDRDLHETSNTTGT